MADQVPVAVVLAAALLLSLSASQELRILATHPGEAEDDYSRVRLTCTTDAFEGTPSPDASFRLNSSLIDPASTDLVSVTDSGEGFLEFSLTQEQEGLFSCETGNDTQVIGLAAPPPVNYEGTVMNRSVVFPSSLSAREIELNCAIRPGALAGSYSVTWERKSLFVVLSMTTFDIMVETNFSTPFEYCCRVKIEHMPGLEREYSGPQIMIVGRLLASFDRDIHNGTIPEGQTMSFNCSFTSHSNDVIVFWTVGNSFRFECGTSDEDVDSDTNGCYGNEAESILLVQNTTMFGVGSHRVQCHLNQNFPEEFVNDSSFEEHFNTILTSDAYLNIEPTGLKMVVVYPTTANPSLVCLSCVSEMGTLLRGAVFFKDGVKLTNGSAVGQVIIVSSSEDGEVQLTLTPAQEGYFHCESHGLSSQAVGLAASPSETYDGKSTNRYIVFPSPNTSRTVELSCAIRPGALSKQYTVEWLQQDTLVPFSSSTFDLVVNVKLSSNVQQYQCQVKIEHQNDTESSVRLYRGPTITLTQKVLARILKDIENETIAKGEIVELKCEISNEQNSNISVHWLLDKNQYSCMASSSSDITSNGCYVTDSISYLLLRDTKSLSTGSHTVECVVEQNLPTLYTNDTSFDSSFKSTSRVGNITIIAVNEGLSSAATAGISVGVVVGTVFFGALLALLVLGLCLCLRRGNEKNGNLALSNMSICLCLRRKSDGNNDSKNGKPADQGGRRAVGSQGQANGSSSGQELIVISSGSCENNSMTGEENGSEERASASAVGPSAPASNQQSSAGSGNQQSSASSGPPFNQQPSTGSTPSFNQQPSASSGPPFNQQSSAGSSNQPDISPVVEDSGVMSRLPSQDRVVEFQELVERLQPVAADWYRLGIQLDIDPSTLDSIDEARDWMSIVLFRILQKWVEDPKVPCTKAQLVVVLKSNALRNVRLAEKIKTDHELPERFNTGSLRLLHSKLEDLASRYQTFGIQLGLLLPDINTLHKRHFSVSEKLECMLDEWRKANLALSVVIGALRRIHKTVLADELQERWRGCCLK